MVSRMLPEVVQETRRPFNEVNLQAQMAGSGYRTEVFVVIRIVHRVCATFIVTLSVDVDAASHSIGFILYITYGLLDHLNFRAAVRMTENNLETLR